MLRPTSGILHHQCNLHLVLSISAAHHGYKRFHNFSQRLYALINFLVSTVHTVVLLFRVKFKKWVKVKISVLCPVSVNNVYIFFLFLHGKQNVNTSRKNQVRYLRISYQYN